MHHVIFALAALLCAVAVPATAGGLDLHTVDGGVVEVQRDADDGPTLLMTVSVSDLEAAVRTRELRAYADQRALRVVLVSTDPAKDRIAVMRWSRRHAGDMPVVADPDLEVLPAALEAPLTARLLAADGHTLGTWHAWDNAVRGEIARVLPSPPTAPVLAPIGSDAPGEDGILDMPGDAPLALRGGDAPAATSLRSEGERAHGPE